MEFISKSVWRNVPLLGVAGYFVAFNPRSEELERRADCVMKDRNMIELLDVLGFND